MAVLMEEATNVLSSLVNDKQFLSRFWSCVDVNGNRGSCWEWKLCPSAVGYGRIGYQNLVFYAHRIAWIVTHGLIPEGLLVCHKCDNRLCCNPDHLFLGSRLDNVQDMVTKGRNASGTHHGMSADSRERRECQKYLPPQPKETFEEYFWSLVESDESGCWAWFGSFTSYGYGRVRKDRKEKVAHRVAYELLVGPIPEGLVLDHLCNNRWCVNPDHLEPVTQHENIIRGEGLAAKNRLKTHCPNGHRYDTRNTWIRYDRESGRPFRQCRKCYRQWSKR